MNESRIGLHPGAQNATYGPDAQAASPSLKAAFRRTRQPGQSRWDLLALNRSTGKLRGIMIGTSTVAGTGASPIANRFANLLEKMLQSSYNPSGIKGGRTIRATDSGWVNGVSIGTSTNGLGMTSRTVTYPSAWRRRRRSRTTTRIMCPSTTFRGRSPSPATRTHTTSSTPTTSTRTPKATN